MTIKIIIGLAWIAFLIAAYKFAIYRGKMHEEMMEELETYIDKYLANQKQIDPVIIIDRATWAQAVEKWPELAGYTCYGGFKIVISDGPPKGLNHD